MLIERLELFTGTYLIYTLLVEKKLSGIFF